MRNVLVVAMLAGALSACGGQDGAGDQMGLTNWEKAPPLRAGIDDGAAPGPANGMQGGPDGQGPGAQGPGAASVPAAAPGTVPVRKAGLWQTTVNSGRGSPQSGQLCVDEQSELRRGVFSQSVGARGGPGCEPKIAKQGATWTYSMSCTRSAGDAEMRIASSQTLTGDLAKSYQVKGTATTAGGPNAEMNGTRAITASGTYVGPCPAGMKAGDFKGPDGQIRNVMQGRGGPGGGQRRGGQ